MFSHTWGWDTFHMLTRKLKANRWAKTTQGIHIMGMEPPYAGSITPTAVALLLMLPLGLGTTQGVALLLLLVSPNKEKVSPQHAVRCSINR